MNAAHPPEGGPRVSGQRGHLGSLSVTFPRAPSLPPLSRSHPAPPTSHHGYKDPENCDLQGPETSPKTEPISQCKRRVFSSWVGKIPWRRPWQPTPVFLSGEFHGQRSLVGISLCICKELDTAERLTLLPLDTLKQLEVWVFSGLHLC